MPGDEDFKKSVDNRASIQTTPQALLERYYKDFQGISVEQLEAKVKALNLVDQISMLDFLKRKKREFQDQDTVLAQIEQIERVLLIESRK